MAVGLGLAAARADLVLQDDFSGRTPATNRFEDTGLWGAWPTTSVPGNTAIVDDSAAGGLASTNALFVDTSSFHGVAGVFDIGGPDFDEADLSIPGNALELRFRFRVPALAAGTNNLRFGILNNGGTQQTGDNQGTTGTDTIGFGARIDLSPDGGNGSYVFLFDENASVGGNANMLGGGSLGVFGSSGSRPIIGDTNAHEAVFRVTRTTSGYSLKLEIDGGATFTATTNNFVPITSFQQFGIMSANGANDLIIDDVEIDRNTLRNGTFERGQPVSADGAASAFVRNWTTNNGNTATRQAGLVDGSHTAVFLDGDVAANRGVLSQVPELLGTNWQFEVDFAAEDGGGAGSRSFNLMLVNSGNSGQINLRVNGDGGLDAFNGIAGSGGAWFSVSPTNLVNFVLDANGNNMFDTNELTAVYHMMILGTDYGLPTASYDLSLYNVADPNTILWSTNDLTIWQNASAISNNVLGIGSVQFTTANGTADFAIDNVSLLIIPEPSSFVLVLFGLGCAGVARRRSRYPR